ncbi:hypothetical protein ACJ4V0_01900 [Phreatobacter sp. HK31-P]
MLRHLKLDSTVEHLATRTYSAGEVIHACDITGDMLTNYISKSGIELCSPAPGRGRSRQFCLIDVYLIALLSRLGAITRNVKWTAQALNWLTSPCRSLLATDIQAAEPLFWTRAFPESAGTYIALADQLDIEMNGPLRIITAEKAAALVQASFGSYLNLTITLGQVDKRLTDFINGGGR